AAIGLAHDFQITTYCKPQWALFQSFPALVSSAERNSWKGGHAMKRHKGIVIILLLVVLARVPIPGKTGQAASLVSRAVLAGYEKTICSNSHSLLEQTARQVALGISCPNDTYQFP